MGILSVDLRKRVVSAVGEEGMSCRAAARRFGFLCQRNPVGGGIARARQLCSAADGRRHAFAARGGAWGLPFAPSPARA